jgi:hypothetical protein
MLSDRGSRIQLAIIWLAFTTLAFATLKPLWSQPGWPENHEFNAFVQRTQVYAAHCRFGDFLPIWSSVDNDGFGSPAPLFYHKLFYAVAATLFLLWGNMKAAIILAIGFFLILGAWGMYLLMRALGSSRLVSAIAGLSLIVANYTVTDWLVRGAVAELSGYMLVPWTMLCLIRSVQRQRIDPWLGVVLGVVFLAHSVLSFYLGLLYAATLLILILAQQIKASLAMFASGALALFCFLVVASPYLLAMKLIGRDYEITREISWVYQPKYQFQPWHNYLWDTWRFGHTWHGFSVQIDLPMTVLVIAAVVLVFVGPFRGPGKARWQVLGPVLPFMLLLFATLLLQMRLAAKFYEWMPGAAFIQFPWRLLAIIAPAAIVFGLYMLEKSMPDPGAKFIALVFAISMVVGCGAFRPLQYGRLKEFDLPLAPVTLSVIGEFIPRAAPLEPYTVEQVRAQARASSCEIESGWPLAEVKETAFSITCKAPSLIGLPLYASRAHQLLIRSGDTQAVAACAAPPTDLPALCGVSLPAGRSVVEVRFPTYPLFFRSLL